MPLRHYCAMLLLLMHADAADVVGAALRHEDTLPLLSRGCWRADMLMMMMSRRHADGVTPR